ncbi:MAG: exodeoxyribonuclease V subunit gamma, partial [Defluviitaleaceae bacterium]|nr:exodeoxyribonuclease V subunit gamma [Defluviitaleaceae bacterium]
MRVQFILGGPGTGKTTYCHKEIAAEQEKDGEHPLILIVPEQYSMQSEKALITATSRGFLSRARVMSFQSLAHFVLDKTGGIGKETLDISGKSMVLKKIITSLEKEMKYFKTARDTRGFLDSLDMAITEFIQYDISPDGLKFIMEATRNETLKMKLWDVYLIYSNFLSFLEEKYISGEQLLDVLAGKAHESDFLKGAKIWIDGFKGFTPQEKKVISALMMQANFVKITLPISKKTSKMPLNKESVYAAKGIRDMVESLGGVLDKHILLEENLRHKNAEDMAFLQANFLDYRKNEAFSRRPENIHIFESENIFAEVEDVARLVQHLTTKKGYKYSDIALIAADLPQYEKIARAVFERHDIPIFIDSRRSVMSHPVVEFIFASFAVLTSNWAYEEVFRLLRLPVVLLDKGEIDHLENYVLAYDVKGKSWQADLTQGKGDLQSINESRQKLLDIMEPLTSKFTTRKKYLVKDMVQGLYQFLMNSGITSILSSWMDEARASRQNETLREHEQIWDKVIGVLNKMLEILPDEAQTIKEFAAILEAGMEDLGIAPPSLDQLLMGDLRRSRFGKIKALVIMGAKDGSLPSNDGPITLLSNEDRGLLEKDGIKLAKDALHKIFEEEFLIYSNFSKPSEMLVITYPIGNLDGEGALPARLIERVRELFPHMDDALFGDVKLSSSEGVFSDLILELGIWGEKGVESSTLHNAPHFLGDDYFAKRMYQMEERLKFTKETSKKGLPQKAIEELYNPHIRASVSKLQNYIKCPFSYFVQYNLRAKPRKAYDVAASDIGNIYHDILSKFGDILKTLTPEALKEEKNVEDMISKAIDEVLEGEGNKHLKNRGKHMHFAQKMRHISKVSAKALVKHLSDGGFNVAFNEVSFGIDEGDLALPPIAIGLEEGKEMLLEGRIDRVDMASIADVEYVKIIDYKSGTREF